MRVAGVCCYLALALSMLGCRYDFSQARRSMVSQPTPEKRAVAYLAREVPRWRRENHCFSCHNNGDAARALYVAASLGYAVSASALGDTAAWLRRPDQWENNEGDPGISDKRLAMIQFTAALATAIETKQAPGREPLLAAARKLVPEQNADGAWLIEPVSALGSPATYGTHLATVAVLEALAGVQENEILEARRKAEAWLRRTPVVTVLDSAAVLMGLRGQNDPASVAKRKECWNRLRQSQTRDGGWGPYVDSPPEPFDTAVVLLALVCLPSDPEVEALIRSGREYLFKTQLPDGSWPETTRPSGGESYAQRISTTGWAALALLRTTVERR
jgi:hypothetical protein